VGGEGVAAVRELRRAAAITLSLLVVVSASCIVIGVPLEKMLSHWGYAWTREYPWYPYWRGALVNLLIWLSGLILASLDLREAKYLIVTSAVAFIAFHYASVVACAQAGYSVRVLPLAYVIESKKVPGGAWHLDLGQVVALVSAAEALEWGRVVRRARRSKPT